MKRTLTNFLIIIINLILKLSGTFSNDVCSPELYSHKIANSSAVGNWYLIYAPKFGDNLPADRNTCGFFNTMRPCKCIGVNIESNHTSPFVPEYSLTNYGYHEKYKNYSWSQLLWTITSHTRSIFNVFIPLANVTFTIAVTGTDNFENWVTFTMCEDLLESNGSIRNLTWIMARRREIDRITLDIALNSANLRINVPTNDFIKINHNDCPVYNYNSTKGNNDTNNNTNK